MPSFLSHDTSSSYAAHADILNLDPNNQFGLAASKETVNDASIHQVRSRPINESYDDSSVTSTHDSDESDRHPMPSNGNGTRPTSMSSLSNVKSTGGQEVHENGSAQMDKPRTNGIATLPDRTAPRYPPPVPPKSPTKAANDWDSPTADSTQRNSKRSHEMAPNTLHTIPSGSAPPNSATSPKPSPYTLDPLQPNGSPQRFSSPAAYPSGASSSNNASNPHLQPPTATPGLRQRHTLEVPRSGSVRNSKDELDSAQASGRFSPTIPGTGRRASLSLARRTTRSMHSDMPRDEVVPDEDAVRWAEAYRAKRASKRKRKEEEDEDRVVVGTKVDENHANWVTAYNMLTGIRVSVSRTNAKIDRELTDADFEAKQKSTFDITGNELVPSAKYDFKFKDYAPWVFRRLRALFRLDPADYLMSLTGKYILSELGSPGKSGSFFYFSRDYKYIIKTIHHAEHKFLRKILKDYYNHVRENPNTLLSQFYGLHRVKMPYGKKIHFVVMNNLFPPHRDIHTTFDLKGSTIGRDYREENLEENPRATLKDLNWLRRKRHLELGMEKKRLFLEQLQRDVVLLKRLKIMDYSLLIGIHDLSRGNEENLRGKTLQVFNPGGEKAQDDDPHGTLLRTPSKLENARKARELRQMIRQERPIPMGQIPDTMPDELGEGDSRAGIFNQDDGGLRATHENNSPAEEIYYLGVIDCLTHYGMIKKIEHFWKGLSSDRTQISALPPDQYGDRFYNFVEGITMSPEAARREAQLRDQELQAQILEKSSRQNSWRRTQDIPPMPSHQPPVPPPTSRSPEARETVAHAAAEARRTEMEGASEKHVPDRTLYTGTVHSDARDPQQDSLLPVVQEVGEQSDARPRTPAKGRILPPTRAPPPTPPTMKPESADSGYAGAENGTVSRDNSFKLRHRISRESLNKDLPPLPQGETADSGVKMIA
ncbi:hypothetical protein B0I35DRAFT_187054 [Stachybotrys elegans]|uniref:1-phosphatidylinositol-4-phosphate 5-kinase n=1 Tax=Stachybotrys elegans TaxID=80388 RepID=A0A8K0SX85_9HYPO|nr:hypothetical protein B0I35DRAFT_187054 [Stachybotrys elegans]